MRISLERLVADGFELALPRADGRVDRVALTRAVGLSGGYAQDRQSIGLEDVAADELHGHTAWYWPGGSLSAGAGTTLRQPQITARIALGELGDRKRFAGRIALAGGDIPELSLEARGTRVRTNLSLSALVFEQAAEASLEAAALGGTSLSVPLADGEVTIAHLAVTALSAKWTDEGALGATAKRLEARGIALRTTSMQLTLAVLVAERVHVERDQTGAVRVQVGALSLQGLDLTGGDATLRIDDAQLPAGASWSGHDLAAPELTLDSAVVSAAFAERRGASSPTTASRGHGGPDSGAGDFTDLSLLDHLDGKLDVDLTVDAKVPFIRRRVATHEFRIPIRSGLIDYHRLERDLSFIEDAIIDFAVRDGQLVLETNLPLSPFRGQPLATWALDADELVLARQQQLVKLSRLRNYHLPVRTRTSILAEFSTFELTRLEFDNVAVDVRLSGPAALPLGGASRIRFGSDDRPALGQLVIEGHMQYRPGRETKPTEMRLAARDAVLGFDKLRLGATVLDVRELGIGAIEGAVMQFRGFTPSEARGTLRNVTARGVRITPPIRAR